MKKFKIADLIINIALIAGFAIYWLIKKGDSYLAGYCMVGCWQVISIGVHVHNKCFVYRGGSRNIYHWVTFISIVTMPVGSFHLLLWIAPFMAVFYTWLGYHEVYVKMQRPLAVLK